MRKLGERVIATAGQYAGQAGRVVDRPPDTDKNAKDVFVRFGTADDGYTFSWVPLSNLR